MDHSRDKTILTKGELQNVKPRYIILNLQLKIQAKTRVGNPDATDAVFIGPISANSIFYLFHFSNVLGFFY